MRFVFLNQTSAGFDLDPADAHHLKVLRVSFPYQCTGLFDGKVFELTLQGRPGSKEITIVDFTEKGPVQFSKSRFLVPLINAKRLEFAIEKLVEFGVGRISLYFSDHTTYNKKQIQKVAARLDKLQNLIRTSCQQSGNLAIPMVDEPRSIQEVLHEIDPGQIFTLGVHGFRPEGNLGDLVKSSEVFLVGPEGDFSPKEYKMMSAMGMDVYALEGERILRSETAIIYLAALLNG